jgi:hypothetical protein
VVGEDVVYADAQVAGDASGPFQGAGPVAARIASALPTASPVEGRLKAG